MTEPADAWGVVACDYLRNIVPGFLPTARELCALAAPLEGARVLDIGCGPGTVAYEALAAGAIRVVGVDQSPGMVALARTRAAEHNTSTVSFLEGDAQSLPLEAASVDVVLSNFGVIFALDPGRAVAEMARVLKPGGRLAFSAWPRRGAIGAYYDLVDRHLPPVPSPHDPYRWGEPEAARAWLAPAFTRLEWRAAEVPFCAATPEAAWEILQVSTGRVVLGYRALPADRRAAFDSDMANFFRQFRLPDGSVSWPREALLYSATRR